MAANSHQPVFDPYKTLSENLQTGNPTYRFLGFELDSVFGMAACPGTANSAYVNAAFSNGFDIVTYKTQRSMRFPANPFPNVLQVNIEGHLTPERAQNPIMGYLPQSIDRTNFTIANSCGNNCEGPEYWVEDARKAIANVKRGQLLIISVVGTIKEGFGVDEYHDDFAKTAELAVGAGAKVIELNLSCPNVASEGVICYSPRVVEDITRRVKERVGSDVKILAKIGYFRVTQEELLRDVIKAMAPYISGIAATNTLPAPIIDRNGLQAFPGPGREKAGISGSAIKWAGIDMTTRLANLREFLGTDYAVIGVGGVMSFSDYKDYINAGADAVQSATGAMWNPELAHNIKKSIAAPFLAQASNAV